MGDPPAAIGAHSERLRQLGAYHGIGTFVNYYLARNGDVATQYLERRRERERRGVSPPVHTGDLTVRRSWRAVCSTQGYSPRWIPITPHPLQADGGSGYNVTVSRIRRRFF